MNDTILNILYMVPFGAGILYLLYSVFSSGWKDTAVIIGAAVMVSLLYLSIILFVAGLVGILGN